MNQPVGKTDDMRVAFERWCVTEKQALWRERREIERERKKLELEKKEFLLAKNSEEQRVTKEKQLFEMKWKILEDELKKIAEEKRGTEELSKTCGEPFFVGVCDQVTLKKRYKDLIKIYHPDNLAGDLGTIQEINREYDLLQAQYG